MNFVSATAFAGLALASAKSSRVIVSYDSDIALMSVSSPSDLAAMATDIVQQSSDSMLVSTLSTCSEKAVSLPHVGMQLIDANDCNKSPEEVCGMYMKLSSETGAEVTCELSREVHAYGTPNDPLLEKQWGSKRVKLESIWGRSLTQSNEPVVVAVIDTGIDYRHPDLAGNMWLNPDESCQSGEGVGSDDVDKNGIRGDCHGANFVDPFRPHGDPMDDAGHGSHCAGVIGAVSNNGIGIAGTAANVRLMAVKFLGRSGGGSLEGAIASIDYAISKGAKVMSNSWGARGPESPNLSRAVRRARDANVVFVSAAGNDNVNNARDPHWPCNVKESNTACVASTNDWNFMSFFSNHGAQFVDVAAPGSDILSTVPGNRYATMSGTSMATPLAAGIAALVVDVLGENYAAQDVVEILVDSSEYVWWWNLPLPFLKGVRSGGIVDAENAVLMARKRSESA